MKKAAQIIEIECAGRVSDEAARGHETSADATENPSDGSREDQSVRINRSGIRCFCAPGALFPLAVIRYTKERQMIADERGLPAPSFIPIIAPAAGSNGQHQSEAGVVHASPARPGCSVSLA